MAISDYSSHDWRKHTDSAVVVDKNKAMLKVNERNVYFMPFNTNGCNRSNIFSRGICLCLPSIRVNNEIN